MKILFKKSTLKIVTKKTIQMNYYIKRPIKKKVIKKTSKNKNKTNNKMKSLKTSINN